MEARKNAKCVIEDRVNPQDQEYSRSAPYQQGLVEAVSPQHTDQTTPLLTLTIEDDHVH